MCIRDSYRYGHFGAKKCVSVLRESCLFRNMEKRVRKILRVCELCQKSKVVNCRVEGELNYIKVEKPFDLVAVDSVSYTHLDVYKRQVLYHARSSTDMFPLTMHTGSPLAILGAYIDLKFYKQTP